MWSLVFRLAILASTMIVAWNFVRAWAATLGAPEKPETLPPATHAEIAATVLAKEATRHVTAIEIAMVGLGDKDLWQATERFTSAVGLLKAAVLAEPEHYRRAKRLLGQILIAADQTCRHFARHYAATPDPDTKRAILDVTGELADAYERAARRYAKAGAAELEIEAQTLKELLRRNRL